MERAAFRSNAARGGPQCVCRSNGYLSPLAPRGWSRCRAVSCAPRDREQKTVKLAPSAIRHWPGLGSPPFGWVGKPEGQSGSLPQRGPSLRPVRFDTMSGTGSHEQPMKAAFLNAAGPSPATRQVRFGRHGEPCLSKGRASRVSVLRSAVDRREGQAKAAKVLSQAIGIVHAALAGARGGEECSSRL